MGTKKSSSKYPKEVKRGRRREPSCPAEELCRTYSRLREEEEQLAGDIAYCEERIVAPDSEMEKQFFMKKEKELLAKRESLSASSVGTRQLFETARLALTENQRAVIDQFYLEKKEWQDIHDADGCIMSAWKISDTRKKAFLVMDEVIAACMELSEG